MNKPLEFHPVAELLPLIEGTEFDALVQDIRENGLIEPIWIHPEDGRVIDGRNRYRACLAAGVEPRTRTWDGKGSLVSFVISMNIKRRHLTTDQQALIAVAALPFYRKEAEARQLAAGERGKEGGRGNEKPLPQDCGKGSTRAPTAAAEAAKAVGISARTVEAAYAVQQHAPELYQKVVEGKTTFAKATRTVKESKSKSKSKDRRENREKVTAARDTSEQAKADRKIQLVDRVKSLADGKAHPNAEVGKVLGGECTQMLKHLRLASWVTFEPSKNGYIFTLDPVLSAVHDANPPQPALGNLSAYTFLKNLRKQIIARREKDRAELAEELASGRFTSEQSRAAPLAVTLNWIEDEFDKIDVSNPAPLYTTLKELRKEVTRKREEAHTKRNIDITSTMSEFSSAHKLNPILDLIESTLAGLDINPLGRD